MSEKTQTVWRFVYSEAIVHAFKKLTQCAPESPIIKDPAQRNLDADILRLPEIYQELLSDGIDPLKQNLVKAGDETELTETDMKLPTLGKSKPAQCSSRMGKRADGSKVKLPALK